MKRAVTVLAILVCLSGMALPAAADCIVTSTAGDLATPGSLGACIVQANSNGAPDLITFNIPIAVGPVTILPTQEYVISEPFTTIDGYSQPGALKNTNAAPGSLNTKLMISVDGSAIANNGLAVFAVETNHTIIKGLNVHSGPLYEISIGRGTLGCAQNRVQGCFLGTDVNGTLARPSGWLPWNPPTVVGVYLARRAANNYIGSDGDGMDEAAERNLISGEARDMYLAGHGVLMDGSQGSVTNTLVAGNLIGTTPNPDVPLGNNYGVTMFAGVSNNTIAGNVIAGNYEDGIWGGSWMGSVATVNLDNRIFGNFIGINPITDNAVPNAQDGIHLNPGNQGTLVGITGWTLANVISGNGRYGVFLAGSATNDSIDNTFVFNIVGLDTSGADAVPNGRDGFHVENTQGRNYIGDATDGNLISGNLGDGVQLIDADSTVIQNSVLGLNMAQDTTQANGGDGISLHCSDVACCDTTIIWQNRIHGSGGHGIGLYGYHTNSDIGPNTIDYNGGSGILSLLADNTNILWGQTIEHNGDHGLYLQGTSAQVEGNTITDNGGWGILNHPYYGGDLSPAGAGNDVVGIPAIDSNDIDANQGGGIVSSDCKPANGTTLHINNTIGNNNFELDVLQLWFGAVEIIDSGSPPPITTGAYTVTLTDLEMVTVSGGDQDGGLWGGTGFDSTDVRTWFTLVQYTVDNGGTFRTHTPHTVVVTGPTGGTVDYSFDGVDNDLDTCNTGGCSPAGIDTYGQFRYQVAEVMTQTDSDGDGVPDATDCAPFDPGFQGTAGGIPCDADLDGYCDDSITGGVQPSACPSETICMAVLCTPTDCLDTNASVNPGASEGPFGDPTCSDTLDNDCNTLVDMNDPNCPECTSNADCDDGNMCTTDTCSAGLCVYSPRPDGSTCNDGLYCNVGEACLAGACAGGAARDCSAFGDQCNTASCDEMLNQCTQSPVADGTACEDAQYCTVNEACLAGTCTGGAARDCSSLDDQCNTGVCDDTADQCTPQPVVNGTACDDGLYCTENETCQAGSCTAGSPIDCSSLDDMCNLGACDESGDTCYADPAPKEGLACDDGDACTMTDTCSSGTCSGAPLDSDGDSYVSDACAGGDDCNDSDASIHPNAAENCTDGIDNDCDGDTDGADSGCAACNTDADCDDSNACNGVESCVANFCQPGTPLDCDDLNLCTTDSCDPSAGCQYADNTLACDDSDACTMNDVCSNGVCAGVPLDADGDSYVSDACPGGDDCDDADSAVNPGAAEVCDDTIDNDCDGDTDTADSACAACTSDPDCDDSNVCNGVETCVAGFCQPGTSLDCDDANPCTDDSCDSVLGCVNTNNTAACDDADACTVNDVCSNGTCTGDPLDADNDGYQPPACGGSDCDDSNAAVNPDADEICDDTIDNDCNGDTDDDDAACQGCPDADGDGFASDACGGTDCCDSGTEDVPGCTPETAADINPDAIEMCTDEIDNNCDGDLDLDDEECKRPAGGCDCSTNGGTSPAFLLGLLGLMLLRRRKK